MSNKDLFKQAIAEAKTIREAAITNAKEALEESLTPHLKEMLAQKLQEMERDEEDEDENVKNENIYEAEEEEVETEEGEEVEGEEAEEESEEEELDLENMSVEEFKDLVRDIVAQEIGEEGSEEELPGEEAPEGEEDMVGMDSEEEININELLAELQEMDQDTEINEDLMQDIKALSKKYGDAGAEMYDKISVAIHGKPGEKQPENAFTRGLDKVNTKLFGPEGSRLNKPSRGIGMEEEVSEELEEALETIAELRTQLQEVNLLNAKLLYVNKVFKANNLTESQKVNVVAAFDKAETVKEVKLVFETVSKNVVAKPATIKEHKSFASSAAGTAATAGKKEIISEVSEQVARWQKLAGIIK